jgi:membrane protease YdiL (CAAX protease family)
VGLFFAWGASDDEISLKSNSVNRASILVSSLLVWYLAFTYIKPQLAKWIHPLITGLDEGPKLFIGHFLIFSFSTALICGFYWWVLAKKAYLSPLQLKNNLRRAAIDGFLMGLLIVVLTIPLALYRWNFQFELNANFWKIAGNLFSNTYEEIQYRGLILLAGLYAFRHRTIANLLGAVAFAYSHDQYPLEVKIYIGIVGYLLGWVYLRTKNFAAPVIAHCVSDWVLDSIFR